MQGDFETIQTSTTKLTHILDPEVMQQSNETTAVPDFAWLVNRLHTAQARLVQRINEIPLVNPVKPCLGPGPQTH